jgi:hypothetical protein
LIKADKSVSISTRYMFNQKCGRRVKANFIQNVIQSKENCENDAEYLGIVTKSEKTRQNAWFFRRTVKG